MKNSEKSPKKLGLIIAVITLVVIATFGFIFYKVVTNGTPPVEVDEKIVLDAEYRNTDGKQIELAKVAESPKFFLEDLIAAKKSFVVYVSLPVCSGDTARFKQYVLDFEHQNSLSFYYLTSDYVKDTSIYDTVKYFPSIVLYDRGELKTYLRYDSDEDLPYYQSAEGFANWFNANVEY